MQDAEPDDGRALVDIAGLQRLMRAFTAARGWKRFHTPKNLAMALVGEAGELAAVLQWVDGAECEAAVAVGGGLRQDLLDEMADVMIYLAQLADVIDADLDAAVRGKMARNEERFPPASAQGDPAGAPRSGEG